MSDSPVSREEFRMLSNRLDATGNRLDSMDVSGTRGMTGLMVQVQQLAKDVAALGLSIERHEVKHDRESALRSSARKWWAMAVVGVVAAVDGPIVTVILQHGH